MINVTRTTETTVTGYTVVANLAPERVADHTKAAAEEDRPFGFIFRNGEATLTPVTETVDTVTITMTPTEAESLWEFLADMRTMVFPDRTYRASLMTKLVPVDTAVKLQERLVNALQIKDDL